jgi:hypothetical protein
MNREPVNETIPYSLYSKTKVECVRWIATVDEDQRTFSTSICKILDVHDAISLATIPLFLCCCESGPTEKLSRTPDLFDRSEWRSSTSASQDRLDSGGSDAATCSALPPWLGFELVQNRVFALPVHHIVDWGHRRLKGFVFEAHLYAVRQV